MSNPFKKEYFCAFCKDKGYTGFFKRELCTVCEGIPYIHIMKTQRNIRNVSDDGNE